MVLLVALALLVVVACLAPMLDRWLGRAAGWPIAAVLLALGGAVAAQDPVAEPTVELAWLPTIDVALRLRLDGLGYVFSMLVLVIGALVLAYSARYVTGRGQAGFYALMTLFAAAMFGLVVADDVIVLFVLWEITTLCSFFLIARSGASAHRPAVRVLLVTFIGGLSLLVAVVLMIVHTGTTRLSAILEHPVWQQDEVFATGVGILLIVAGFTKSAQFPFHSWLPDAMAASTPVSAYLHAAAMVKAGIYLLLRFSTALGSNVTWNAVLIAIGLLTAVLGAVFAMQRYDLKELLAYSTVSQLGLLVATIGVGTPEALTVAVVHTVAHALFKAALFMLVGIIDAQNGSRDIRELHGLRSQMPWTATATTVAALSMAGVPPLLGFVSKEGIFAAMLQTPGPSWLGAIAAGAAVMGAVFTFGYSMRIVWGAFGGHVGERTEREADGAFLAPPVLLAVASLVLGPGVPLLDGLVSNAASAAGGTTTQAHLTLWHGITAELAMSAVVIICGLSLVYARDRVGRVMDRPLWPVTGVEVVEATHHGTAALGRRVGDLTRTDAPARHLAVPPLMLTVLAVVALSAQLPLPDVVADTTRFRDWPLVLLLGAAVGAAAMARSRIAAVVLVGGAGFVVALWFFSLGAADVALTQLLVEILTVVVIVLVIRRLPRTFHWVRRSHAVTSAAIAVTAGAVATMAVYGFTGRRVPSPASQYFLENTKEQTGGSNVVNAILVDFRALDTLGELTVLGFAGVAIIATLRSTSMVPDRRVPYLQTMRTAAVFDTGANRVFVRTVARLIVPVTILLSLFFLLRGHYQPGGGFIAALMAGAGFSIAYLSAPSDRAAPVRWPYMVLIGGGVVVAVATGLAGLADGGFLRPLHAELAVFGGVSLTTALVFDVGVYLAVLGVVLTALNQFGVSTSAPVPGEKSRTVGRETTREGTT